MLQDILKKLFGTKHQRALKKLRPLVAAINDFEPDVEKLSDDQLRARIAELREQVDNGASVDDIMVPTFAITREGARRALGMRHYDVQLIGGITLHQGRIAEMKTGEGKTLVATLPCVLNALEGKGVHVVTVNDYLASRDAEWMGRLYNFLGLSVGVVVPQQPDSEKKRAYRADITYGQNNEFGFDYMRDNMKFSIYDYVQRDLHYAIVDEVDSILIDEARTPLIISGPGETASDKYTKISDQVLRLRKDEHFQVDEKNHSVTLTEEGIERIQHLLHDNGLTEVENLYDPVNLESLHILMQSLRAHSLYKRDQHYMVSQNGEVLIIDEFTGRVLPGRRWSDGLHQAVEAKEHVPIKSENRTLATISFQNLFRLYGKLSGMTGTADTEAGEFHKIYELDVQVIPTNKPITRADEEDLVYKSEPEKFKAVFNEIVDCHERGQPVLVGTTSVEKSEALARMLKKAKVPFNVLNAKQHEREAYVVAQAGRKGSVTVATNMAGRGTDIVLGGNPDMLARHELMERARAEDNRELLDDHEALEAAILEEERKYEDICKAEKEEVLEAGGLAIIGTERHESRRIDNQLRGRSGRQGDPGRSRFYLSLEDDLMRIFAGDRIQGMMDRLGMEEDVPIEHKWVTRAVENAQRKVEERNFDMRKNLLEYDDVMNQQRKSIYALRKQVLEGQYRVLPTEDEAKKGKGPTRIVTEADPKLQERLAPILKQMVQIHGSPTFDREATNEEIQAWREKAYATPVEELGEIRRLRLERDVYEWFGCRLPIDKQLAKDPAATLAHLEDEVALSLTEQRERMLESGRRDHRHDGRALLPREEALRGLGHRRSQERVQRAIRVRGDGHRGARRRRGDRTQALRRRGGHPPEEGERRGRRGLPARLPQLLLAGDRPAVARAARVDGAAPRRDRAARLRSAGPEEGVQARGLRSLPRDDGAHQGQRRLQHLPGADHPPGGRGARRGAAPSRGRRAALEDERQPPDDAAASAADRRAGRRVGGSRAGAGVPAAPCVARGSSCRPRPWSRRPRRGAQAADDQAREAQGRSQQSLLVRQRQEVQALPLPRGPSRRRRRRRGAAGRAAARAAAPGGVIAPSRWERRLGESRTALAPPRRTSRFPDRRACRCDRVGVRLTLIVGLVALGLVVPVAEAQDCTPDDALARAAAAILERDVPPTAEALLEIVRAQGSDAPVVDALIIRDGDAGRRERFLDRVRRRRGTPLACGDARFDDRWLVLSAPRAGRIEALSDSRLRVELAPGWGDAHLYVEDAAGTIWQHEARSGEALTLPGDLRPPLRAQLVAEGPGGPRPIAERRFGGGVTRIVADSDEPVRARIAHLREHESLLALRDNRLLADVAETHATRMCREGRVSHVDRGGDPRERLAHAGLSARHVGEVVARAANPSRAYAALLQSPSHRAALSDRRFTDVGIGRAHDHRGRTCLVVLLAAWPRPLVR